MFSSKSKDSIPAPQPMAAVPASAPKRPRQLSAPSIISSDMVINGTLVSTGDVQIDGRVEGDVRSVGLVIGDKAEIHGEIFSEDVTVRGKVMGRIRARKVLLAAMSKATSCTRLLRWNRVPSSKAIAAIPTTRLGTCSARLPSPAMNRKSCWARPCLRRSPRSPAKRVP